MIGLYLHFFVVLDLTDDPSDVNDILHTLLVFGFFRFCGLTTFTESGLKAVKNFTESQGIQAEFSP